MTGKRCTRLGGKTQGLFQNFLMIGLHGGRLNAGAVFVNPYQSVYRMRRLTAFFVGKPSEAQSRRIY
jgi:hypothetical protein